MLNLTPEQKNALCWIVQKIREGRLEEEFKPVFLLSGEFARFEGKGADITEKTPITEGALYALGASKLLNVVQKERFLFHCTLLGKAYEAVDLNFEEINNIQNASLPQLFYVLSLVLLIVVVLFVFLLTHSIAITGFIMFVALLSFSLIGAFMLRHEKLLSEKNFLHLVGIVWNQIPLLLGKELSRRKTKVSKEITNE